MKIYSPKLLKMIFNFKRNFSKGIIPNRKIFDEVEVAFFKNNVKSVICISADFELNWAWKNLDGKKRDFKGSSTRKNFPYIMKVLEDYSIPITWATVGHLFLYNCKRSEGGLAHSNMPRPTNIEKWKRDWYRYDPCTNYHRDPLWYAPDLIEKIMQSRIPHEIGTHSFSHIDFSLRYSNNELIIKEIEECIKAMSPFGLKPRSLVFPFNKMEYSYLNLLSDLNIIAVRHRDNKIRLSYPERTQNGVYKIYESMNLRSSKYYNYIDKAKMFIEEAIKRRAVYHLWFHPSDPIEIFKNEFRSIIEHIALERDKGIVGIATMGNLATYCESREKLNLNVQKKTNEINVFIQSTLNQKKYGSTDISLIIPLEHLPSHVIIEKDNIIYDLKQNECITKNKSELIVNVPVEAKLLRLKL